jgi:GNAT superfamily N-acetyltransferase
MTMTDFSEATLRVLNISDLDALLALYKHLHVQDLPLPERALVEQVWHDALNDKHTTFFGIFLGESLVGSCVLHVMPNLTRGCRPYALIENVVTHAAHRGRGCATRLLHHALAQAWAMRCYKTLLLTGRKDEATLRFYEKAGFSREGKTGFVATPLKA